jgi:hypothetical protein
MARATTPGDRPSITRTERVLATMSATVIGLSALAILALLAAGAAGVRANTGIWLLVAVLPAPGLAIGFLLLVALMVLYAVRRSRESRDSR